MAKIEVLDLKGQNIGEVELRADIFDIDPNKDVMFRYVRMQLTNRRQGTASTKTRAEVKGTGKKPFPQKHTGRARQGSLKGPHQRHGGVAFGPKPRDFNMKLPKKMKQLALKSALSTRYREGNLIVIDDFRMDEIKTKTFKGVLKALDVDSNKNLVVLPFKMAQYENTKMSGKNIKQTKVIIADNPGNALEGKVNVDGLNVFDIINNDKIILTKDTVKKIEEVLG
ncbi:MAG TPA: 50S ribosomal protein L4 [Thermotogota bacterium]|nr:50S ribosomal protein L4 [Thermotogota bacterium]HPJ88178.1 50S ribosomal protein L4 [Thermotogota bacterium]HPR95611.1 50S ribosomal protein L4 [Thermotogota bacterium]